HGLRYRRRAAHQEVRTRAGFPRPSKEEAEPCGPAPREEGFPEKATGFYGREVLVTVRCVAAWSAGSESSPRGTDPLLGVAGWSLFLSLAWAFPLPLPFPCWRAALAAAA